MKTIPLLIVIASIVLPIALAGRPRPQRSLRTLWVSIAIAALVWCGLCLMIYPRYVWPE